MSAERTVPTSQPRREAALAGVRRAPAICTPALESRAPQPSTPSTPEMRSARQVLPAGLRQAEASRIARQPSGQDLRVGAFCWISAAPPATAGAAMLVPLKVSPTVVTTVPLAAISGSSRSECDELGFLKTVSEAIPEAVSLWLPTLSRLKPLWLTYSVAGPLPEASQIVGYGQCRTRLSL